LILTDREILIAIEGGAISIEPRPVPNALSSTSVDLTLDPNITIFKPPEAGLELVIDPTSAEFHPERTLGQITDSIEIGEEGYCLRPNTLVLAWTCEEVDLKPLSRIAARVEGKSSLARIGLGVHITAPTIHAGFKGRIRLEMVNHGGVPIRLRHGMHICQLIFEATLGTPQKGYTGRFYEQDAPA